MRNITLVSTKDHFLFILTCESETEEMWSDKTGQCINFVTSGSWTYFLGNHYDGWNAWANNSSIISPALTTRTANVDFGVVATSDNTLTFAVIAKEDTFAGIWADPIMGTAALVNPDERAVIEENSNNVFVVSDQCYSTPNRNVNTFELIVSTNDIPESEVTII